MLTMEQWKLEILADVSQLKDQLGQATTAMQNVVNATKKTTSAQDAAKKAAQQQAQAMNVLTQAAAGLGISLGVAGLISVVRELATESVQLSLRMETQAYTLGVMAGSADEATLAVQAVQNATRGAISEVDAMSAAARSIALGWGDTSEQLEQFVFTASTLGRAFRGLTPIESIDMFNRLLANRSIRLLDDFGISVAEINRRLEETGAIGTEAWQQVALQVATERAQELAGVWETNQTQIERLSAAWTDFKTRFGETLEPTVIRITQALTDILSFSTDLNAVVQETTQNWIMQARTVEDIETELARIAELRTGNAGERGAGTALLKEYATLVGEIITSQDAFDPYGINAQAAGMALYNTNYEEFVRLLEQATENVRENQKELDHYSHIMGGYGEEVADTSEGMDYLAERVLAGRLTLEEYAAAQDASRTPIQQVNEILRQQEQTMKDIESRAEEARKAYAKMFEGISELAAGLIEDDLPAFGTLVPAYTLSDVASLSGNLSDLQWELQGVALDIRDEQLAIEQLQVQQHGWSEQMKESGSDTAALGIRMADADVRIQEHQRTITELSAEYSDLEAQIGGATGALDRAQAGLGSMVELQLNTEQMQTLGEAYSDFAESIGREDLISDDVLLRYGLATEEQLAMRDSFLELEKAIATLGTTLEDEDIMHIFDLIATGQTEAADSALEFERQQDSLAGRIATLSDEYNNLGFYFDEQVRAMDEEAPPAAESALSAMEQLGEEGSAALAPVETRIANILEDWRGLGGADPVYLRGTVYWSRVVTDVKPPSIDEPVSGPRGGRVGGGAAFITSGPLSLTVGDNPGGRELVMAVPLSGRGTTRMGSGGASMAGGGILAALGNMISPRIIIEPAPIYLDGILVGRAAFEGVYAEARDRGRTIPEVN